MEKIEILRESLKVFRSEVDAQIKDTQDKVEEMSKDDDVKMENFMEEAMYHSYLEGVKKMLETVLFAIENNALEKVAEALSSLEDKVEDDEYFPEA